MTTPTAFQQAWAAAQKRYAASTGTAYVPVSPSRLAALTTPTIATVPSHVTTGTGSVVSFGGSRGSSGVTTVGGMTNSTWPPRVVSLRGIFGGPLSQIRSGAITSPPVYNALNPTTIASLYKLSSPAYHGVSATSTPQFVRLPGGGSGGGSGGGGGTTSGTSSFGSLALLAVLGIAALALVGSG